MNAFADACFTVSLAGSLFLSVSFEAARPRIIVYLLFTMAPFAVVAPLLGPMVDRVRGGHRAMIAATLLLRGGICAALVGQLRDLVVFPLAFSMLVLAKTYSVTRNALIPRLVPGDELVSVNSRLSRLGTISSGLGGVCAAALLAATSARWVPLLGAGVFAFGVAAATRLPETVARPAVVATEIAWRELHARTILAAQSTMVALRGATGFWLFLVGFGLKRAGAPTWFFGLVFVMHGAGSFAGHTVAPVLRRRISEAQMLAGALASCTVVIGIATIAANRVGTSVAAFGMGLSAAVVQQAFYATVAQHAPDVDRGRTLAAFDTRFQLAWVIGALAAVVTQPNIRVGFAALTALLVAAGVDQLVRRSRDAATRQPEREVVAELALAARRLASLGEYRAAVLVVVAAAELLERAGTPPDREARVELDQLRARALADDDVGRRDFERGVLAVGWAAEG